MRFGFLVFNICNAFPQLMMLSYIVWGVYLPFFFSSEGWMHTYPFKLLKEFIFKTKAHFVIPIQKSCQRSSVTRPSEGQSFCCLQFNHRGMKGQFVLECSRYLKQTARLNQFKIGLKTCFYLLTIIKKRVLCFFC